MSLDENLTEAKSNINDEFNTEEYKLISTYPVSQIVLINNLESEVMTELSKHPGWLIRAYVAKNPKTNYKTLDELAYDQNDLVRYYALNNPNFNIASYRSSNVNLPKKSEIIKNTKSMSIEVYIFIILVIISILFITLKF